MRREEKLTGLLHIYGQEFEHGEAFLVGSLEGLLELADAIRRALTGEGRGTCRAFAADGEGYEVHVVRQSERIADPAWVKLKLPYTAETARHRPDGVVTPDELIRKLKD